MSRQSLHPSKHECMVGKVCVAVRVQRLPTSRSRKFEGRALAFNAINGEYCRMNSQVGLPLPVREQLEGERGNTLLDFDQHKSFKKLPRHSRPMESRFRHHSLAATTAYEPATYQDGTELNRKDAKRAFAKLNASSLVWLTGRHFTRRKWRRKRRGGVTSGPPMGFRHREHSGKRDGPTSL